LQQDEDLLVWLKQNLELQQIIKGEVEGVDGVETIGSSKDLLFGKV
jgi:hypothetical protein